MASFFDNYFQLIDDGNRSIDQSKLKLISDMILRVKESGGKIFIIGNGGKYNCKSRRLLILKQQILQQQLLMKVVF